MPGFFWVNQADFCDPGYRSRPASKALPAFTVGIITILLGTQIESAEKEQTSTSTEETEVEKVAQTIPRFRLADIQKHDGHSGRPWVTKGNSVYDITDWVGAHPGGEVILRAAGGNIDPYWDIFTIHKCQDVLDILEQYKIGEIDERDLVQGEVPIEAIEDPFADDPARDLRLRTLTARPCNAETPGTGLTDFLTPNELFYVRNHMWVPVVEKPAEHQLTIELPDGEEKSYSLQDLKERFKRYKITATLQCAGNRRKDMTDHAKQTNGLQWTVGAISSAEWEGVKLKDVLADAGLDTQNVPNEARHAQFVGLEAYGASIPMSKAVDPYGDVLLAFKMNGEDLPPDHGYPLRVVVPGNVAARSVKWLRKIVISDEESLSQWQRRDYKCFGPNIGSKPDWTKAVSIQEMPVTSAITSISGGTSSLAVQHGQFQCSNPSQTLKSAATSVEASQRQSSNSSKTLKSTPVTVEGYAYSGGGRAIVRVDISVDGGKSWDQAELLEDSQAKGSKAWCWKRWRYSGALVQEANATILVKATDEAYNTQPQSYESIYNARGNLTTAWHRVDVGDAKANKA
jgi:sulfite oxidase